MTRTTSRRLAEARLLLLFTPELVPAGREPLDVLAAALPHVDLVQVRVKGAGGGPSPAKACLEWAERVLDAVSGRVPVLVNDRVDVAAALLPEGLAGVHLGHLDLPPAEARALLGPEPLIGLSTHSPAEVARAAELPVDLLGFGPVHPTRTKGYPRGLGPEAAWAAAAAARVPLFAIGGIDAENASELAPAGRAAVGSGILAADDPARAAAAIRAQLVEPAE